jgi:hypothetical protein
MYTVEYFQEQLNSRFGGKLRGGKHGIEEGACCLLEFRCAIRECDPGSLSDEPEKVQFPDLRCLNDSYGSEDEARTNDMLPVLSALWDWDKWSEDKRKSVVRNVSLRIVNEILPIILRNVGLEEHAKKCEEAKDLSAASAAGYAASAARKQILSIACRIWVEAV